MTAYDQELIEKFDCYIKENSIQIHENFDEIARNFEKYVHFSGSRIAWRERECVFFAELTYHIDSNQLAKECVKIIARTYPKLQDKDVLVFCDGGLDLVYQMRFSLFAEVCVDFFEQPAHVYVWFANTDRCLNYTFESCIYFGGTGLLDEIPMREF